MKDMYATIEYQIWKETLIQILGEKATELLEKKVKEKIDCEGKSLKSNNC